MPEAVTFRDALLTWSRVHGRDLPWRRTRDGWSVLVSEVMLQQTQVSRVRAVYGTFLDRFPTVRDCADAPAAEVVQAWSGLGYNRRAVQLHRCARACVERHGGRVPAGLDELLALPGVGAYTARAVMAFAYEGDVGVVDTNAARVLARAVAGASLRGRDAQELADRLVPTGVGWEWNQAMLDLGATYCRPVPRCVGCPVRRSCRWQRAGAPAADPAAGSFGTTRPQTRFEGSDRQGRGRLVTALRAGTVPRGELARVMGCTGDEARAERIARSVVADGLAEDHGTHFTLRTRPT